jgi:hypothetical protein
VVGCYDFLPVLNTSFRQYYCGKHQDIGLNIQVMLDLV